MGVVRVGLQVESHVQAVAGDHLESGGLGKVHCNIKFQ